MADMSNVNTQIIEEFRTHGGKVGGNFEGAPMLLLHTIGARSGQERVNPMMYQAVGDDVAVFASKAGADTHPDWFHNLVANPEISMEIAVDGEATSVDVTAQVLDDARRDQIWQRQTELYPGFADYQAKTARVIPVVLLTRR